MEYELVSGTDIEELNMGVIRKLNQGWKLYGNPFSVSESTLICQAMIKEETMP